MTLRWQERKLEDDLLKRELLLRLRAEHHAAPGQSRPATDYFRRRVRSLMLRRPLFALKYHLLAIDLSLGLPESPKRRRSRRTGFVEKLRSERRARTLAGALVAVGLAAAAAAVVAGTWTSGSGGRATGTPAAKRQPPQLAPRPWWHPPRPVSTPTLARQGTAHAPKLVERRPAKPHRRTHPPVVRQTILVSNTVPAAAATTATSAATAGGGPTPLKAPKTASAGPPSPLRAPRR